MDDDWAVGCDVKTVRSSGLAMIRFVVCHFVTAIDDIRHNIYRQGRDSP
jgi:hypothetical protein